MTKSLVNKRKKSTSIPHDEEMDTSCSDNEENSVDRKKVRWDREADDQAEENTQRSSISDTDDDESTIPVKIYLAAWCQSRKIGVAYYDPVKCTIYTLPDTEESQHFDLMEMILEHTSPDVVLTSSRSDDNFIDLLRQSMETSGGHFRIRPHKEFSSAKGRERLLSLRLLSDLPEDDDLRGTTSDVDASISEPAPRNAYDFMRRRKEVVRDPVTKRWNASIRLASSVSVESSPFCMASVGALLDHLVREHAINDLEDEGIRGLEVRAIEIISLYLYPIRIIWTLADVFCRSEVMQINADALFSLQIFENESHASVHSDKTKEGLSLAGVLNITCTALGRSLMRMWLLRPSLSLSVVNARHDAVECFLRPENITTAAVLRNHLKGMKNLPRILGVLRTGKTKLAEWQGLVKFTLCSAMLRKSVTELHDASDVHVVQKLISALDIASFRGIGTRINEIIDWEESSEAQRVCVRSHIDEELDNRKHVYHGIDTVLSKVAEQICQTVPVDYATSLNVVYFPQLGFLICVPLQKEMQTDAGIQSMDDWSFQFSSESHVYFKSQEMHDMDAHIGDLHSLIVDREIEIIQELLEEVLVHDHTIAHACDVCAELDCLLAFAEVSRTHEYRRPVMVEDNVIDIVQGRHPLQEMVVDTFVPNDARICGGSWRPSYDEDEHERNAGKWNNVVVCTGANACGKSVYLKQIAMIVLMAQIGCFVPAESATLGIVDKIFTRISTRESVSKVQSAFMIDLNQVSLALRNCTARSLILLDEFGKGTLPTGS
ncbi:dna mismatch repair protein msh5 [Moniliophthora roreri]|nr:dna mismatch repair protein msh5 [Moniliophthora roreri]